ncbi:hypothetical protein B0H34DRAFT_798027 [Crassisporium funariophilum]|nr:hypothetical protein B0H34DRAFT_798027 [Crassisporium funariophilum]
MQGLQENVAGNYAKSCNHAKKARTPPPSLENDGMDINPMPAEPDIPHPKAPTPPHFVPPPTRSGRTHKFPQMFTDFLPNLTTCLPHLPEREPPAPKPAPRRQEYLPKPIAASPEPEPVVLRTRPNEFGLYCVYASYPTKEINDNDNLDDLCDSPGHQQNRKALTLIGGSYKVP